MGRLRVAAVLSLAAAALSTAQQDPTFRVDVRLVRLLATVKDNSGKPVGDVTRNDLSVFDNGVPQEIALFERYTEQPLSVALLVDSSASTGKEFKYEAESVGRFLKALFREGNTKDTAALFTFNWQVQQHTQFTRSLDRLEKALRTVKSEAGTSMYDALWLGAGELEDREGRKVVILVTDGGDTVSQKSFHEAQRALHRADAILYSVLVMPITNEVGRNIGGENALQTLSTATGGRVFAPSIGASLDRVFDEILRELRTQYLVGYYPRNVPPSRDPFHRVQVKAGRPGLHVVTRTGYYGDSADSAAESETSRRPSRTR